MIKDKIGEKAIYYSVRLIMHNILCAIEECNAPQDDTINNSVWCNVLDNVHKPKSNKHITFNETTWEYIIPNCRDYLSIEERQHIWYTAKDYTKMREQALNEVYSYMFANPGTSYHHCIKKLWTEYNFIPSE